jgi:predicted HicB family RNase H-like nuclease
VALLHFQLDDLVHRRAKSQAALRGVSLKSWLEAAILAAVEQAEAAEKARKPGKGR